MRGDDTAMWEEGRMRLVRSQKRTSKGSSSASSASSAQSTGTGSSVPPSAAVPPIPDPPHPPTPRPWATLLDQRLDEIDARHPGDGDQLQWAIVKLLDQVLERNVSVAEYLTAAGCPIWLTLRTLFLQRGGSGGCGRPPGLEVFSVSSVGVFRAC